MPRKLKKKIAKEEFSESFSYLMMDVMLNNERQSTYSKKLPSTDLAFTLQIRNLSSKAYIFICWTILPYPHLDTLKKKLTFLRSMTGTIIHPVMN